MIATKSPARAFWEAFGLNALWINASEILRYFLLVRPMMRRDFAMVPDIVPMNIFIFALWTLWDGLLIGVATAICWLVIDRYGSRLSVAVAAGTLVWAGVFVLLWLGLHNMGLATPSTIVAALPLAWTEMVIAALIVGWRMSGMDAGQADVGKARLSRVG